MDLSPESLRSVRYHTSLITGDSILNYWHISHDPMTFAKNSGYAFYTAQVPSNYHLSEPFNVHVSKQLGVKYNDNIINMDVEEKRFYRCDV